MFAKKKKCSQLEEKFANDEFEKNIRKFKKMFVNHKFNRKENMFTNNKFENMFTNNKKVHEYEIYVRNLKKTIHEQ